MTPAQSQVAGVEMERAEATNDWEEVKDGMNGNLIYIDVIL